MNFFPSELTRWKKIFKPIQGVFQGKNAIADHFEIKNISPFVYQIMK